jgi:C4-dicarboxylate-specific signal transduction histidine kinase
MIDTGHLGAAPDDPLTLASDALREAKVDLAHIDRITTMGRLTASAAHEVTNPIATIVTNAQAARHFLDCRPSNLDEIREALDCTHALPNS